MMNKEYSVSYISTLSSSLTFIYLKMYLSVPIFVNIYKIEIYGFVKFVAAV